MTAVGGDVIGLDWRSPLDEAWQRIGYDRGVQEISSRRCCSARGSASSGRPSRSSMLPAGGLVTSSTSVTASCRTPIPPTSSGSSSSSTNGPRRWPREGRRRPHGRQPERVEDIRPYLEDIREGRPVSDAAVEELTERYRRIGGRSPLDEMTERQRAALEAELGVPVFVGMKHWQPRIADAVEEALAGGAETIVGLVLAPHYSKLSIDGYRSGWRRLSRAGPSCASSSAGTHEPYLDALAERVQGFDGHVVFTAHSLPARILDEGDPYQDELLETSRLIAERAGLVSWSFAYQSASATGEPWLGPDILDELDAFTPAGSSACSSARSASSRTTSRSSGTSTSKRENGPASWVSSSTGSIP